MIELMGWVGTILIALSYLVSVKANKSSILHVGNFVGSIVLMTANLNRELYDVATLNFFFGAIGLYGLLKSNRELHKENWLDDVSHVSCCDRAVHPDM